MVLTLTVERPCSDVQSYGSCGALVEIEAGNQARRSGQPARTLATLIQVSCARSVRELRELGESNIERPSEMGQGG